MTTTTTTAVAEAAAELKECIAMVKRNDQTNDQANEIDSAPIQTKQLTKMR